MQRFWKTTLIGALALGGCVAMTELAIYRERPIRFGHESHGTEAKLTCEDCHQKAAEGDQAGMPAPKACTNCHKTPEERAKFLTPFLVAGPDGKQVVRFTEVTKLPEDVKFSHKQHLDRKATCADCHGDVEHSKAVSAEFRVAKDRCFECHASEHVQSDCKVCHQKIDADWTPSSHQKAWTKRHGFVARLGDTEEANNRCELCHQEGSCASCHQDQPPANHNNHWRHRAHGLAASVDAEGCATCHRGDSCERCHNETAPRTHVAGWGGAQSRHCLGCHLPLASEEGCAVCHKNNTSHNLAKAKPAWHTPGMNCRQCHRTGGQPLPHVDKGDNCSACHF